MDLKEIKKLISLMNENGLCRLEIEEEGRRVVLEKPHGGLPVAASMAMTPAFSAVTAPRATPLPVADDAEGARTFNSPMVGTFYLTPTPEAPPFAKVGDKVGPDTTLCLIEAMKVFNEVKAEMNGVIVEILAEDKEAVEYNQPLFLIRPA